MGFPRLYAAASLKRCRRAGRHHRFPRLYAAASLKRHRSVRAGDPGGGVFSAALCRGLIEAAAAYRYRVDDVFRGCRGLIESTWCSSGCGAGPTVFRGFMPRPQCVARETSSFSAALCRGLEARDRVDAVNRRLPFSAALCRGLIEATSFSGTVEVELATTAALCRGLTRPRCTLSIAACRFPRLYAAASLKPENLVVPCLCSRCFPRLYAAASLKRMPY